MSHVDNWLLLPSLMDDDESGPVSVVNARLAELDVPRLQRFRLLDARSWGGSKFPERGVFGMAANHLPEDFVIEAVISAPWSEPQNGLLLVCRQDDDTWQSNKLNELRLAP